MRDGLQLTEQALARARNRAVLPVLAIALESCSSAVRAAAIRASIRRLDSETHTQLIRQFHLLDAGDRAAVQDAHRSMPHHAARALKTAVLEGDTRLNANACDIIHLCRDLEQFKTLVRAVEKPGHRHADRAAATLLQLATELHDEILAWAKGDRSVNDPSFLRHRLLSVLERSLNRRADRHRPELIEAFLLLAPTDSPALLSIMRDPSHPCHVTLQASLIANKSAAVMERLVAMLRDIEAPTAVLEAIARRTDKPFVDFLLHELKYPVELRALHNMKRLRSVIWLEANRDMLLDFDGRAQAVAVDLAVASRIDRVAQYELVAMILKRGLGEGRRMAAQALATFHRPEANELVMSALNDPDSAVQAAALRQLRQRRIPSALEILVSRLDSPVVEIRDAARSSLAEFNFVRYKAMFDLLDENALRTTGALVRRIDHSVPGKLIEEMTSPSISARQRGIEMAVAMGAVDDVRTTMIALAQHENASVRREAVAALAYAHGEDVVETLEAATTDSIRSVADAARASLEIIRHGVAPSNDVASTEASV
jgi:HEAT repeat protein